MEQPTSPELSGWTMQPIATAIGVEIVITIPALIDGDVALAISRSEARDLARAILAAAGDGIERTFVANPRGGHSGG